MHLDIMQVALHQLRKRPDQELELALRSSLLTVEETAVTMLTELHQLYSVKSKALGYFTEQSELAQATRSWRDGDNDFLAFSRAAAVRLRDEVSRYPFAEGGVILFCHYRHLATDYLLMALLTRCHSLAVDDQLEIQSTEYLDLAHADIVARLNLTEWETQPESRRYLTWLKGRVGRKVADFFLDFLGAEEGVDAKAQNRGLLQAVEAWCQEAELPKSDTLQCRQQVYDYCKTQHQAGNEIALTELAQALPGDGAPNFQTFVAQQGYNLEETFPADQSTLRQLTRFSGSGGGLTLTFEQALLDERIFWDAATDTLTIRGTPPNLRDQLQRAKGGK